MVGTTVSDITEKMDIDLELVKQVQRGNKRAFDALVVRYQHKIVRLVSRYISDPSEVYDVVQECFIRAYRSLPSFRGESKFYSWLYRVALNTTKTYLQEKSRRPPAQDLDFTDVECITGEIKSNSDGADPERLMLQGEIEEAVFDALDNLPDEMRNALILRELAGLSYEEISGALKIPVGTVRSRLARAKELISYHIVPDYKYSDPDRD